MTGFAVGSGPMQQVAWESIADTGFVLFVNTTVTANQTTEQASGTHQQPSQTPTGQKSRGQIGKAQRADGISPATQNFQISPSLLQETTLQFLVLT
jgi:hypothetical protein